MDGWVSAVFERHVGTDLDADAAAGATSITVTDPDAFDYDGGALTIFDDPLNPAANTDSANYTLVFDDEGYPTGVLLLDTALAHSYTADQDTRVAATSAGAVQMERVATLQIEGQEEELIARVDQSLRDRLPGGPRDPENMEQGQADFDDQGELVLKTLIALDPDVDGTYIDPTTLPPAPPPVLTDGFAPPSSPTPTLTPGPSFLGVNWTKVTNADPVTYDVHISTSTGFTPAIGNRVGSAYDTSSYIISTTASGGPLVAGTTYFVKLVAKDADGSAAASAQASGSIVIIPAPGSTDGSAPASSPTPTVTGGPNYIAAKWQPVANVDPVTYEVHISTSSGFTPSGGTKYGETAAGSMVILKDATGAALTYSTTYYVKLVAKDGDGAASAGAQGSSQMVKITGPDISVANLAAINSNLGTLTAGVIDASVVTVSNLTATNITTGTLNAGVVNISNLDATKIVSGDINSARMQTNVLTALKVTVSQLDAISANLGVVTAGIFKTATGVTWTGNTAGFIISQPNNGIRSFNGAQGTYELRGSDGAVAVGALLGDSGKTRIEILASGMSLYEGTTPPTTPPPTGGGSNAALAWTTLYIAGIGATQTPIVSIATGAANPLITTASPHGLTTGDTVRISGHLASSGPNVLSAANGTWTVTSAVPTATTLRAGLPSIATAVANTGTVLGGSTDPNRLLPKGQFTTSTDISAPRMWFDYQGLHSQAQFDGVNQNAPFRTFDFNPADATGLRLHSISTPNALVISPLNGVSFKLAADTDPTNDLAARWVRQSDGSVAMKVWGDNLGNDDINGQFNGYAYGKMTSGGKAQAQIWAVQQSGYGTSYGTGVIATTSQAGPGVVTASGFVSGTGRLVTIIKHDGTSSFVQGTIIGSTGINVTNGTGAAANPTISIDSTVARRDVANTFAAAQTFSANVTMNQRLIVNPSSDQASCDVRRGTDTSPTLPILRVMNSGGSVVFFQINKDGDAIFNATTNMSFNGGTPVPPPNWTTNTYVVRRNMPSSATVTPGNAYDCIATIIDDLVAVGIFS